MISGTLREFAAAFGRPFLQSDAVLDTSFTGVTIDSRQPLPGSIFVAIVGENQDGHNFVKAAVAAGSPIVIVNKSRFAEFSALPETVVVGVDDTLAALQQLAQSYLRILDPRKVAVTGTNGKTTCKNLIAGVLGAKYRVCASRGNLNNQFGVPLSIFEFDRNCEIAVFEFGMSTPGEIKNLVELYDPDVRVILNIGPAHLETMKTIDAIAEAKFELLHNSSESDWAVLNFDDPNVRSRSYRYRVQKLTFAANTEGDVRAERVFMNGSGHGHLVYAGQEIILPVLGVHHVTNCLAAIAVARIFDVPFAAVKERIEKFVPAGNRMTAEDFHGLTIINDAYNSNPVSAKGALDTIAAMQVRGRRVVVFGDMLELGEQAPEFHADLGRKLAESRIDRLIVLGEFAQLVRDAAIRRGMDADAIAIAATHDDAVHMLSAYLRSGDLLLLKASRGLQLEIVEQGLKATWGRSN